MKLQEELIIYIVGLIAGLTFGLLFCSSAHAHDHFIAERILTVHPDISLYYVAKIDKAINKAATVCGVDRELIAAVMEQESYYRADAVGAAGERGLMQILGSTAHHIGLEWELAYQIEDNVMAGACYLAKHIKTYGNIPDALARYNGSARKNLYANEVIVRWFEISQKPVMSIVVKPGDTLSKIAKQFYGDMRLYKRIAHFNNLANPNLIHVGQRLYIPFYNAGG